MVWALTPVDTVPGAPPSLWLSPSGFAVLLWVSVDGLVNACSCVSQGRISGISSPPGRIRSAAKVPPWTSPLVFLLLFIAAI